LEIVAIAEKRCEIVEPDELAPEAERILEQHRLVQRLACRPDEEHERDYELWSYQRERQPRGPEDRALLHVSAIPLAEASTAAGRSKLGAGYRKRADAPRHPPSIAITC